MKSECRSVTEGLFLFGGDVGGRLGSQTTRKMERLASDTNRLGDRQARGRGRNRFKIFLRRRPRVRLNDSVKQA